MKIEFDITDYDFVDHITLRNLEESRETHERLMEKGVVDTPKKDKKLLKALDRVIDCYKVS